MVSHPPTHPLPPHLSNVPLCGASNLHRTKDLPSHWYQTRPCSAVYLSGAMGPSLYMPWFYKKKKKKKKITFSSSNTLRTQNIFNFLLFHFGMKSLFSPQNEHQNHLFQTDCLSLSFVH
jgi:hypothetical protein